MNHQQGNDYSVELPEGVFTALGMEYYIVARDTENNEIRIPENGDLYSIKAHVTDVLSTEPVVGGSVQNAYRMISIPLFLNNTSIVGQIGDRLPLGEKATDWRLFRFSPGSDSPQEYPNIEEFSPGKAFWLISKNNYTLRSPDGTTVTTNESFSISLAPGWNDIANPWMFDISSENIENPSKANIGVLYSYEGSWSDPVNPPDIIEPWKGYAVRNMENHTVVIKLLPELEKSVSKQVSLDNEAVWELIIKASAGLAVDHANRFGVRHDASIEWDRFDFVEPPAVGEYVSVTFPHKDWQQYPYDYTVDFRPSTPNTQSWDFAVRTNISKETVTVHLEGIEHLPDGYSVKLLDLEDNKNIDLKNGSFDFISGYELTERYYRITVTDIAEPESPSTKPEYFITASSFPNPFNPQTTIRYELPLSGVVNIDVYNAVGQLVKAYDVGYLNEGVHELEFNTEQLTSGIYIYHIHTSYSTASGKMLFMK
ncbi:T9SS type A sorting domain-containing protein [Candidatus Latescibacterota bacterium]